MQEAVILSGVRTPIGAFMGDLSTLSAPQLGAVAIREAVKRAKIQPEDVGEVLMGCVLQGGLGQAPARQAAIGAGLPQSVPCVTINKVCGSGVTTVVGATRSIRLGDFEVTVAGGMESMSQAPYFAPNARKGLRMGDGKLIDMMVWDGLWDPYNNVHMGNCGDLCAREMNYTREQIDDFASESYRRAIAAQAEGRFTEEIVPVVVPQRRGDPLVISADEEPSRSDHEKFHLLKPAFDKEGVTTAGNASSIDDGAAAMVLCSAAFAKKRKLKPLGRVVGYSVHAQDPMWFTTAPVEAVKKLLDKHNLKVSDIDLYEINEAFAVVAMVTADKLRIPLEKLNVNGGAVALGHPIGMTGTRLILTALHELRRRGGRYAIASPCIGGGEANAVLIEAM